MQVPTLRSTYAVILGRMKEPVGKQEEKSKMKVGLSAAGAPVLPR